MSTSNKFSQFSSSFISPSFLMDHFTKEFAVDNSFLLALEKCCAPSSCPPYLLIRNRENCCVPIGNASLLFGCFEDFCLCLWFTSLIMRSLGMHFFASMLFGICSVSSIYTFMSCHIWEVSSHYLFE